MRICFIPIDNRPVCYNLPRDIVAIDKDIEIFLPPRNMLGSLTQYADTDGIIEWLKSLSDVDAMIISLDTIAYGGLIPSRRISDDYETIKHRIEKIKPFLKGKQVYAFSSIMRISNNNYNEEEKFYWKDYGKKIFQYSYDFSKNGHANTDVPSKILDDYLTTRKRNFEINKLYLEWQKEGLFNTLIFSKDDCAEFGLNVDEARELEKLGGKIKTGADEIPLTLLARAVKKDIKIFVKYTEPEFKHCISNYEDVSIEKSVEGQLELGGFKTVNSEDDADVVLVVNNFKEKQGELVMGWDTQKYDSTFIPPKKPFSVADVRYANGGDNIFVQQILNKDFFPQYGYSAWNTSANTLGSLLAGVKVKYNAKVYDEHAYKKLQTIRLLDDWAYQANVRGKITAPCDIKEYMAYYEKMISDLLDFDFKACYSFPWDRKFEIEIGVNVLT